MVSISLKQSQSPPLGLECSFPPSYAVIVPLLVARIPSVLTTNHVLVPAFTWGQHFLYPDLLCLHLLLQLHYQALLMLQATLEKREVKKWGS